MKAPEASAVAEPSGVDEAAHPVGHGFDAGERGALAAAVAGKVDGHRTEPAVGEIAGLQLPDRGVHARTVDEHDKAVALVSHLPQIIASLLASQLVAGQGSELELSGAGLRDTTRIADSDPALWAQILAGNSAALKPLLISLQNDLSHAIENLEDEVSMAQLISNGQRGRAVIPGKHGGQARNYTYLDIVIDDKPGQLAAIIEACAAAKVNIEDLAIEHTPGQQTGLITLAFSAEDSSIVAAHLKKEGWKVHPSR